ncbi:MAG: alpha/beta hydrolase [Candidatus Izemoplasmatales bacterium]
MDYIIYIIIAVLIISYFSFSYGMYSKIFRTDPAKDYRVVNQEDPFFKPSFDWYQKVPKEEIKISSYDGYQLNGIFIPALDEQSTSLAIVSHGYHACSDDMIAIAKLYSDMGFKVILINHRGHHGSGGGFTSFGYYEKYDVKKWIEYALRTYSATDNILLHGVSMGAATMIQSTSLNLPKNVKYIVADSGFSHLSKMFIFMLKPKFLRIFLPGISLITYLRHRFFLFQIAPIKNAKKTVIPLFIIHGEQDEMVPFSMGKLLFEASNSPYKNFHPVPDCKHGVGYIKDKQGIESFLKSDLPKYFTLKNKLIKK